MNVDVEIYIKKMIGFFETNPNDLSQLIGDTNKEKFYTAIKNVAYDNFNKKSEAEITRTQLINIVLSLYNIPSRENDLFQTTMFGSFCLN